MAGRRDEKNEREKNTRPSIVEHSDVPREIVRLKSIALSYVTRNVTYSFLTLQTVYKSINHIETYVSESRNLRANQQSRTDRIDVNVDARRLATSLCTLFSTARVMARRQRASALTVALGTRSRVYESTSFGTELPDLYL